MSEVISENMQEAAEPAELEGANETEVAEPSEVEADEQTDEQSEEEPADEQDSKTNAAFAEQRRRIAELEKELEERDKAKELAESEAQEQAELDEQVQAIVEYAREQGLDDDDIEDHETDKELKRLQDEIDRRDEELVDIQLQQLAMQDLAEVQKIDPNIKDLDDLGDEFFRLRSLDIEPKRAYYMIHSADEQMKPHGAYAPGKINQAKQESEYYTSEELDNLSKEEMHANWDKVMRSMNRL